MSIVVQKYGGSSVSTTDKIKLIAGNIIERKKKDPNIVVVVSAMGDTTDDYIKLAKGITDITNKRELDVLMSTGEMISASLLSMSLNAKGCDSVSFSAYQLDISTSGSHGKSQIDDIEKSLEEGKVVIVTGFQGINNEGDITTLGRGGSDTSAVALAVKLGGVCEIYTDVEGTYIRGGKDMKLEERAITGLATSDDDMKECKSVVLKYASKGNVVVDEEITKFSLVGLGMKNTYGVASRVFKIFNENNIGIKLITTSEIRITCAINSSKKQIAIEKIAREFNL